LATEADVLIENFRPGALEAYGLDPQALLAANPGLIMLRVSGYGQTGPYRDKPGFGVVAEAMGGLRHLSGEPGRTPVRVGVSIGDTLAALHGVIGILMCLHERRTSGRGQIIDMALYEPSSTAWKACCPNTAPLARCAGRRAAPCPASRPATPTAAATAMPWWPATATASSSA
jgi:formyl-CoA transferase